MSFQSRAKALLAEAGRGPVLVHSDVFRTARLVKPARDRMKFLDEHIELLRNVSEGRDLWLPAFNYDFPRSRVFDMVADEAQVGPVPERFRTRFAEWRTPVAMFSISGIGEMPHVGWGHETDPFGEESAFARLVAEDGVILYYGETFAYNTIVHHAEQNAGGPAYRYVKRFPGEVILPGGDRVEGSLSCHVRPLGGDLDYDWPRLHQMALDAAVCRPVEGYAEVSAASARDLCEFWGAALAEDPLALLDRKSRAWVEPALEELGRRFLIGDFESPEMVSVR